MMLQNSKCRYSATMLNSCRGIRIAAVLLAASAFSPLHAAATLGLSADGLTVFDSVNNVTWLADANLAATSRFGLPVCSGTSIDTKACVNASGSMSYQASAAWVRAMNAANYLGHTNWQLPTTPFIDNGCTFTGPNGPPPGNSFGYDCTSSALGSLYNTGLGLKAPSTAVPIPNNTVGPFSNFQPYLYWSRSNDIQNGTGYYTFSFNNGFKGSNSLPHFIYVLPMIPGKIPGTPPATGKGLQVNPGGQTVYDPVTNVTWPSNANLAATNTFGIPTCTAPGRPKICVGQDGAMNWDSASQFIANMNTGGGYLGQKNWELPPIDPNCNGFDCGEVGSPMGELFYGQLGFHSGMPVVTTPNSPVGPFHNIQPYLYWTCLAATIQSACQTDGPAPNFEWSFSFGNGFQGTDLLQNDLYVTAYFTGAATSTTGPVIAEVANAEGEIPTVAPNTWVEIKGAKLGPAGDSRIWQDADFVGNQMPAQLDHVSVTVNGKNAYLYYISPTQINVLTPPDAMNGPVQVVVTNNGTAGAPFTAQAQPLSPSFFVFNGGPYVAARHADFSLLGPANLSVPGYSFAPAKPGDIVLLYANGFGPTNVPVISGSTTQSGTLSQLPAVKIGGVTATVLFAGVVGPGQFQFNVVIPASLGNGDQTVTATYGGVSTQPGVLITVHN